MIWVWVVLIVIVVGAVAVIAAGRDTSMAPAYEDRPDRTIPSGRPLTADDLAAVRFTTALRGYRMDEVDAFIDRMRADLIAREPIAQPSPQLAADDDEPKSDPAREVNVAADERPGSSQMPEST